MYRKGTNEGKVAFGVSFLSRRGARRVEKKKGTHCRSPRTASFLFFFFSLSCSSSALLSSCVAFFFFPVGFSNFFSVECVDTHQLQQNASADQQQKHTTVFIRQFTHKKKKEKIHESSAFNIEQFAWSSVFRCCVFFFFFSFVFLPFFTVVEDLVARRVCSFLFFFLLHFQSFASPPVSSFAYRGNAQMSARHSFLPSFFYSCPFLFHVTNERNSMQLNSLSKGKVNKKKKKTTPQTAQNFWFRFRCTWKMRDSILKHTQKKPHSFL